MSPPLLENFDFLALRELLGKLGADGWLLYDFHGINPAAKRVLGIKGMGTRRFFVLLPREGKPVAIAHRIELASFDGFPGEVRPYAAWTELHDQLRALVGGKTVAMEISPADAVPYLDRVPHGVVELIEGFGAKVVSSGTLITRFAARWSSSELEGHARAAETIAEIARTALRWGGSELARGAEVRETAMQARVMEAFGRAGLVTDHPPIVGFQANAANPHTSREPAAIDVSPRATSCCSISGRASRLALSSRIRPGWGSRGESRVKTCVVRGPSCVMPGMQRLRCFERVG